MAKLTNKGLESPEIIHVSARKKRNETHLHLVKGQRYYLEVVRPPEKWKDLWKSCPLWGFYRKWMYTIVRPRIPYQNYFALSMGIGPDDSDLSVLIKSQVDVSQGVTFTATSSGKLFLFANDAKNFYWNNSGSVKVRVKQVSKRLS